MNKILTAVLLTVFLASGCTLDVMEPPPPIKPYKALPFKVESYSGSKTTLADLKGSPTVLNFWASWCLPCVAEMPLLQRLRQEREKDGLKVILVNQKEKRETVKKFMAKHQLDMTVLLDRDGKMSADYEIFGFPTTFFIDGAGVVRYRYTGEMTVEILDTGLRAISLIGIRK